MIPKIAPDLRRLVVPIASLHEDPENARVHGSRSIASAKRALAQFGQQKPIVIALDGRILAGNGIYQAARALGWGEIAAVTFVGDRQQQRAFALADNRTAEDSSWDTQRLARELGTVAQAGIDPLALGWTAPELRALQALVDPDAGLGDGSPSAGGGSDGSCATAIEFNTVAEHAAFVTFIQRLRAGDADLLTTGQALTRYIEQLATP